MKFTYNDPEHKQRRRKLRRNQTDAEKILWQKLRNRQFYGMKFFRQFSMGPYIIDFYCPKSKLAIELDGGQHAEQERKEYDEARSEYLRAHGVNVMRFWNNEIMMNIDGVLEMIAEESNPSQPPLNLRGGEE